MLIIEDSYKNTKYTDNLIIRQINQKPEMFLNISIATFSKNVNTAVSTISKFVRRLGFKNYRDFQNYLTQSYLIAKDKKYDILTKNLDDSEIKNSRNHAVFVLDETVKHWDNNKIEELVNDICKAQKIILVAYGGSYLSAVDLSKSLNSMGCYTLTTNNVKDDLNILRNLTQDDLVIFISEKWQHEDFYNLSRKLKELNIKTVAITSTNKFFINDICYTINFCTLPTTQELNPLLTVRIQEFFVNSIIADKVSKIKNISLNDRQWINDFK